jgi:ribosomal protein L11 methyltransferase
MAGYKGEIVTSEAGAEALATLLTETLDPPPSVSIRETKAGWLAEIYFTEPPDQTALQSLIEAFPIAELLGDLKLEPVPDENWVEKTQAGLHPVDAGRFFVHGSHDRARAKSRSFAIEIDAGQAFGTAHHGTTRGCLILLDRLAKKRRTFRALDLGTGSGILAIAAAKTLCPGVIASDIDPIAIRVATENFTRNGVSHKVRGLTATDLKHPAIANQAPFDLVMANILAGPLIALAPEIRAVMIPGGHLILSGLLDHQAREVIGRYRTQGYVLGAKLSLDGWTSLHVRL